MSGADEAPSPLPSVDIVIPTYGYWEMTERCLNSLRRRDRCVRSVIVVDDASPDVTGVRLRERDDITAVVLEQNRGFAGACNAGAARSTADAIFFLNNDTLIAAGTVDRLAATLGETGAACVGPKLVHGDGTLQAAGLALTTHRSSFAQLGDYLEADLPQAQHPYEPLALCGAAILVRRDAFLAAGGFDMGYLNGYEDVDLSLRLWASGGRLRYEPRATVMHLEGASRGKAVDDVKNEQRFTQRWEGRIASAPRWKEPPPPILDVRWPAFENFDRALLATWKPLLRAHAGARTIVNMPLAARSAAPFDRRAVLRIDYVCANSDRSRPRRKPEANVVWSAPATVDEARRVSTHNAAYYWVASLQAALLLENAGVDRERIHVTRIGFAPRVRSAETNTAIVVASRSIPPGRMNDIVRALQPVATETILLEDLNTRRIERIRSASYVVFADRGDTWGLAGTAALAAGAAVVAVAGAPFLEIVPPEACTIVDQSAIAFAARDLVRNEIAAAKLRERAAEEMARRHPDVYAGRRIRELARAHVHGAVDPRSLSMTDAAIGAIRAPA